jgi:hypothetical protein
VNGRALPRWKEVVRIWHSGSATHLTDLELGRDLLLDMPRAWGDTLPDGMLLDDLLSQEDRASLDREAIAGLATWRGSRDGPLTVEGTSLPQIWDQELLAEVFLPETRIVAGLEKALARAPVRRIELAGIDEGRASCLAAIFVSRGIEVATAGDCSAPPTYPGALAAPWRIPLRERIAKACLEGIGVPQRVRGSVYVVPYWHLLPVYGQLAESRASRLVLDPLHLTRAGRSTLARAAAYGGWVGSPGRGARRRSRSQLAGAIATARTAEAQQEPLARLLDARALAMLEQRAGDTFALVACLRRAFGTNRIRLAVLPYDSPPDARAIVEAAREAGVTTLVVQHGFPNEPNSQDMFSADGAWSRTPATLESLRPHRSSSPGEPPQKGARSCSSSTPLGSRRRSTTA